MISKRNAAPPLEAKEPFTTTEQEIVILYAIWQQVDEMVNFDMFSLSRDLGAAELKPTSEAHQQLFNILLVDLLSKPNHVPFNLPRIPEGKPACENSFLFYLRHISNKPALNPTGGEGIKVALDSFVQWLEAECLVENVWLPSISSQKSISLKRWQLIKICGNMSKHSFAKLSAVVKEMQNIFADNHLAIDDEQCYMAMHEFYQWFHVDVFSYHTSTIAKHLNNIRWSIYEYLQPEFKRSAIMRSPSLPYRFLAPDDCKRSIAVSMHHYLMNAVRSEPYMPKFNVSDWLKMRY